MPSACRLRAILLALPALGLGLTPVLAAAPSVVQVELNNAGKVETMKLDRSSVPAGKVRFEVTNASFDHAHEMIVVKTDLTPDKFPTNKDGSKVDEKKFKGAKEASDIKSGGKGTLDMSVTPGNYVLFCNIKSHFKGGMYAELTVTP
jgi:uncharacterized cupredoxin-like copper-binding protein